MNESEKRKKAWPPEDKHKLSIKQEDVKGGRKKDAKKAGVRKQIEKINIISTFAISSGAHVYPTHRVFIIISRINFYTLCPCLCYVT